MYARPAIDSVESLIDRIKYPISEFFNGSSFVNDFKNRAEKYKKSLQNDEKEAPQMSVEEVDATFKKIQDSCRNCFVDVKTCDSEDSCAQASAALQVCMANLICTPVAKKFATALEKGGEKDIEVAFSAIGDCIQQFEESASSAMKCK